MTDLPPDTYVELLPGFEQVYDFALAGTRGWIRDTQEDEYGFEKVYVEWDKNHWRYQGEPDGWTFANHFQEVKETELVEPQDVVVPATLDPEMSDDDLADQREVQIEKYVNDISEAFDKAADSDGFFLITMRRGWEPQLHMEVIAFDHFLGVADDDLRDIDKADILRFVEEQIRRKGQLE